PACGIKDKRLEPNLQLSELVSMRHCVDDHIRQELERVRRICGRVYRIVSPLQSAVRVSDENGRAADPPQRAFYRGDIACKCVKAVLGGDHLVSIRLKRGNHLTKA